MTFVNGGCDDVVIDVGDSSAFNDFINSLREYSDLTKNSIDYLEENLFEDSNWALEIEEGAADTLLENGYKQEGQYYFVLKDI